MSRASALPISALRFYDKEGVLVPHSVDPHTGYRWYTDDQLRDARVIAGMRRVGVPIRDMMAVLTGPETPFVPGRPSAQPRGRSRRRPGRTGANSPADRFATCLRRRGHRLVGSTTRTRRRAVRSERGNRSSRYFAASTSTFTTASLRLSPLISFRLAGRRGESSLRSDGVRCRSRGLRAIVTRCRRRRDADFLRAHGDCVVSGR